MILLLSAIGWGLFAAGAGTHLVHHQRLELLLGTHFTKPRVPARMLILAEVVIAVALPVTFLAGWDAPRQLVAVAAGLLGLGFTLWVARLVISDTGLPCACSFSSAPPSWISVVRAAATILGGLFVLQGVTDISRAGALTVATLLTGAAIAAALYVLPDAIAWPNYAQRLQEMSGREAPPGTLTRIELSPTPGRGVPEPR